jgi:lipopolysaccharide/colanic/teichoic acid biosynthesis glycosyltransferase
MRTMTRQAGLLSYRLPKRIFDIAGAFVALIALGPAMVVIALTIWLEDRDAPVLFRQRRCGHGGRTFELLKFRTMVPNADALKELMREQSLVPWPDFRVRNDPRVTRLGRVLRRTSLDELPQLINVLRGDMTLVGPRPTSFAATTDSMNFEERCRLEIRFFRRHSLRRELWVLIATVGSVLRRTGVA